MPDPVEAVPAATILLVRDGEQGLEVFMVERHHQIDFAKGALVFPGGKIDPADADPALAVRCEGVGDYDAADRALRVGAIRETFEEAGVLLARPRGDRDLVDGDRLRQIEADHRDALNAGKRTMAELVETEDLVLACDLLISFARWITPVFMRKRFDTGFFLVEAPADHLAIHDGGESVDSVWTTPAEAVAAADEGRRTLVFPTLMNVKKLGLNAGVADALAAADAKAVVTVLPQIEDRGGEKWLTIPTEAGYEVSEAPISALTGA